jgi:hypothetical protein
MFLIDELKDYVSASPQSLAILQKIQAEKDAYMSKFMEENKNSNITGVADDDEDWRVKRN